MALDRSNSSNLEQLALKWLMIAEILVILEQLEIMEQWSVWHPQWMCLGCGAHHRYVCCMVCCRLCGTGLYRFSNGHDRCSAHITTAWRTTELQGFHHRISNTDR